MRWPKQPGTAPDVADLLGQARDKLTRDWRQGFGEPDGLILLRRLPATRAPTPNTGPAITPSQMRELLGGWITVEVVDDFERPWRGKVKIELPSSTTRELAPDGQGSTTADGFEPGNAVVTLLDLHETSWDKG